MGSARLAESEDIDLRLQWYIRYRITYGEDPHVVFPETVLIIVRLGP